MATTITSDLNSVVRPPVDFSFRVGDRELKQFVRSLRVNLPWNGRASASTTFGNYNNSGTRPYQAIPPDALGLRHHNRFALDLRIQDGVPQSDQAAVFGQVSDLVQIDIRSMGQNTAHMPVMLGGAWSDQVLQGTWPAYDFTYFLEMDNQHMTDVLASTSKVQGARTAYSVISEILRKYGIASYDFRFPDHAVRQLRRSSGKPSDWIAKVRRKTQSGLRFRRTTATIQPFRYRPPGATVWRFQAGVNYSSFTWHEASQPPYNKFTLTRSDPVKGRVGGQKCTAEKCPGRTIDFPIDPPSNFVRCRVETEPTSAVVEDWVWEDINGVLHTTGPTPAYLGVPVRRAMATFRPPFAATWASGVTVAAYDVGYTINAYGSDADDQQAPYRKIYIDRDNLFGWPDTEDRYGLWEDFSNLDDPLIASGRDLEDYALALLLESVRHCFAGVLKTPLINCVVEPGDWVFLGAPGWTVDQTYWFVEGVSYALQNGVEWTMELALSKGLW